MPLGTEVGGGPDNIVLDGNLPARRFTQGVIGRQWRTEDFILEGTNLTQIIYLPDCELVALAGLSL